MIKKMYAVGLIALSLSVVSYASDIVVPAVGTGTGFMMSVSGANIVCGLVAFKQGQSAGKAGMPVSTTMPGKISLPHRVTLNAFEGGMSAVHGMPCAGYGSFGKTAITIAKITIKNPTCRKATAGVTVAAGVYSATSQVM